jgi:phage recombination protein Bet
MSVQHQQYPLPQVTPFLSETEVALLKRTQLKAFGEDEQETFIRICQRTKLDPFTKQIYATRRYSKVKDENGFTKKVPTLVAVTGIMGLCALAERTRDYDGCEISWSAKDGSWKGEWLEDLSPEAARCVVFHKHRSHPEVGIARWNSYVGQQWNQDKKQWEITDFWARMGDYMLAKCAKAQALRGAFPDQLSNVYIREELESDITDAETETTVIPTDEAKIIENQRREEEIRASGRFQVVEEKLTTGPKPTPTEMTEPALERDKIPEKPVNPPPPAVVAQTPPPAPPAPVQNTVDDIDLSSPSTDIKDAPPPWKDHVILGVVHARFHKRKIGELQPTDLAIIEKQWLPAIREQWDDATDAQRADADAFERAIAYYKMAKLW